MKRPLEGAALPTTEKTINVAIAGALRQTRRCWKSAGVVRPEETGLIKGNAKQPDIAVLEPNVSPVIIETEIAPALTVEVDTIGRLGETIKVTGRQILSAIAVQIPIRFKGKSDNELHSELVAANDLKFAVFTGINPSNKIRWPTAGWLVGGIGELSVLAQYASVPPSVIDQAADQLVEGGRRGSGVDFRN